MGEQDSNVSEVIDGTLKDNMISLDVLSDDSIICIMEYISCPQSLSNLIISCKRMLGLFDDGKKNSHADMIVKALYLSKYGLNHTEPLWSWKEEWERLVVLRRAITSISKTKCERGDDNSVSFNIVEENDKRKRRQRVGILTRAQENSSARYDEYDDRRPVFNLGYFGFETFSYDPASLGFEAVVVHGDFNGIRIFPSLSALLYKPKARGTKKKLAKTDSVNNSNVGSFSVAENQGSQVLAVLPNSHLDAPCNFQSKDEKRPCLFLGFADGTVTAVFSSINKSDNITTYTTTSTQFQHSDEVTTLCFLPDFMNNSPSRDKTKNHLLASGSVDGTVLIYPDATSRGSVEFPIIVLNNRNVAILCMDCCYNRTITGGKMVLFTGDLHGRVVMWKHFGCITRKCVEESNDNSTSHIEPFTSCCSHSFTNQSQNAGVTVSKMLFAMNCYLIAGTNNGEIRMWEFKDNSLHLLHRFSHAHSGSVLSMKMCGEILLTSGGLGNGIKAWHVPTGQFITAINHHEGGRNSVNAVVVDFKLTWNSIVCVKRNGVIQEWDFDAHVRKIERNANKQIMTAKKPASIPCHSRSIDKHSYIKKPKPSCNDINAQWECETCHVLNDPLSITCAACSQRRKRKTAIAAIASINDSYSTPDCEILRWEDQEYQYENMELEKAKNISVLSSVPREPSKPASRTTHSCEDVIEKESVNKRYCGVNSISIKVSATIFSGRFSTNQPLYANLCDLCRFSLCTCTITKDGAHHSDDSSQLVDLLKKKRRKKCSPKWICHQCKYRNRLYTNSCFSCGATDEVSRSIVVPLRIENECERTPQSKNMLRQKKRNTGSPKWICHQCNHRNTLDASSCFSCGATDEGSRSIVASLNIGDKCERTLKPMLSSPNDARLKNHPVTNYPSPVTHSSFEEFSTLESDNKSFEISLSKENDTWICLMCTCENDVESLICETCCSSRPQREEKTCKIETQFLTSDHSNELPHKKSIECLNHPITKWLCRKCTYENEKESAKCKICLSTKPSSSRSKAG